MIINFYEKVYEIFVCIVCDWSVWMRYVVDGYRYVLFDGKFEDVFRRREFKLKVYSV